MQKDCAFAEVALAPEARNRKIHFTEYRAGQHLIDEGEPATGMHVLCKGAAVTLVFDESGRDYPVQLLSTAGVLDAIDNLLPESRIHSTSVVSLTDTVVAFIKSDVVHQELEKHPSFTQKLCRQVLRQMRSFEKRCLVMHSADAAHRLAYVLRELAQICGLKSAKKVIIPFRLKRSLLARLTGTTPETISRVMTSMQKRLLLSRSNDRIMIHDMASLTNVVRQKKDEIQGETKRDE